VDPQITPLVAEPAIAIAAHRRLDPLCLRYRTQRPARATSMMTSNTHHTATTGGPFDLKNTDAIKVPLTRFAVSTTGVIEKRSRISSLSMSADSKFLSISSAFSDGFIKNNIRFIDE
jgi:hypothetical protein